MCMPEQQFLKQLTHAGTCVTGIKLTITHPQAVMYLQGRALALKR